MMKTLFVAIWCCLVLVGASFGANFVMKMKSAKSGAGAESVAAFETRKSQGLMELSRLEPTLAGVRGHPRLRAALAHLLTKLDANQKLLNAKLQAARTVAEVVARAISDGQSDGTYSDLVWLENRR